MITTMWKSTDFPITQNQHEINFEGSEISKAVVFAILGCVKICHFGKFQPFKRAKMHKNQVRASKSVKMPNFETLDTPTSNFEYRVALVWLF